jgi:hypothetical protein
MPLSAIGHYLDLLPKRQAEMRMMQGEAASVPYMDEEKHSEWKNSINQFFEHEHKTEAATPSKLLRIGIKPVFVAPPTLSSPKSEGVI